MTSLINPHFAPGKRFFDDTEFIIPKKYLTNEEIKENDKKIQEEFNQDFSDLLEKLNDKNVDKNLMLKKINNFINSFYIYNYLPEIKQKIIILKQKRSELIKKISNEKDTKIYNEMSHLVDEALKNPIESKRKIKKETELDNFRKKFSYTRLKFINQLIFKLTEKMFKNADFKTNIYCYLFIEIIKMKRKQELININKLKRLINNFFEKKINDTIDLNKLKNKEKIIHDATSFFE